MFDRKQISLIIPVYNVETYLHECLDSVFSQNIESMEVICVNDGSTDNSRAILQEYKERFPVLIIIDKDNQGLPAARNSGFNVAKGKYIYFLDSDDYLLPGALLQMLDYTKNNDLDVGCFNVIRGEFGLYFKNKVDFKEILPGIEYFVKNYELNGFFPPEAVWMYLYKRDFLVKNNLHFMDGVDHEDVHYTPRVFFFAKRVGQCNLPIQFHRVLREGSVTEATTIKLKEKNYLDRLIMCEDLIRFFTRNNCHYKQFYLYVFRNYLFVINSLIYSNKRFLREKFKKKEYTNMYKCVISKEWYLFYWLFRYLPSIYKWFVCQNKQKISKRIVKRLIYLIYMIHKI